MMDKKSDTSSSDESSIDEVNYSGDDDDKRRISARN